MANKRDIIAEIKAKNDRSDKRYLHGKLELYSLESSFERIKKDDLTLISLHIMGIASCIEVSAREAIKRLIDSGSPFVEKVEAFKDHIKFDYVLTKALSDKEITFGDLISHSLPVSRLDHIASHLENLFSSKNNNPKLITILSQVKEYAEPHDEELIGDMMPGTAQQEAPLLLQDPDGILRDVATIFETRHLVAHEANFNVAPFEDVTRYFVSARQFVEVLYELVEQVLNPGASRSGYGGSIQQLQRSAKFQSDALNLQGEISKNLQKIRSHEDLSKLFKNAISAFDAYYEAEVLFQMAMHDVMTGNKMRNVESLIIDSLWGHRNEHLMGVEHWVKFYGSLDNPEEG